MSERPDSPTPASDPRRPLGGGLPGAQRLPGAAPAELDSSAEPDPNTAARAASPVSAKPRTTTTPPHTTTAPTHKQPHRRRDAAVLDEPAGTEGSAPPSRLPHGDSPVGRAARALLRLVYTDAFPNAFAEAIDICQSPVTTGRRIGVISPTGGSGASTITAALAELFAVVRTDSVAAIDLAAAPSGLRSRLPGAAEGAADQAEHTVGLGALAGSADLANEAVELSDYGTSPRPNLLRLTHGPTDPVLSNHDMAGLHRGLSRSRAVSVTELPRPAARPDLPLESFHCLVAALPATRGGAQQHRPLLQDLLRRAPGVPVLPVLVNSRRSSLRTRNSSAASAQRVLDSLSMDHPLRRLDHDRHVATGAQLRISRIGEKRRLQVAELAASALDAATGGLP